MATNPFEKLPAELRVRIYKFALPVGKPLFAPYPYQPDPRITYSAGNETLTLWTDPPPVPKRALAMYKGASLLLVNRTVYQEALPIFYRCNTVSFPKAAFCTIDAAKPKTAPKLDMLVHLHLSGVEMSEACRMGVQGGRRPCGTCGLGVYGLRNAIASAPHLRSIIVDHTTSNGSHTAFRTFKEALQRLAGGKARFSCFGVGQYRLQSTELFKTIEFTLNHVDLAGSWALMIRAKPSTPSSTDICSWLSSFRTVWSPNIMMNNAIRTLDSYQGSMPYMPIRFHHHIPRSIGSIWPRSVPVDIRDLGLVERAGFMEEFDDAVYQYLDDYGSTGPQWVPKW
ncbi:hypothetical protein LTR65_007174 [Meristemomyces frigidus]